MSCSRTQQSTSGEALLLTTVKPVYGNSQLEDLTVLKRSPDLLNNDKIDQDQLRLITKHNSFYVGCRHFGQVA